MPPEFPLERFRDRLVMPLEGQEALADRSQGWKVVGGQNLPLQDGKVDLDLIEPTGMDGTVNRDDAGIFLHKAFHASAAAMRGSVVHDPEHAPWPAELPVGSTNVPTYHTRQMTPAQAARQLDFVFASTDIAGRIHARALNEPTDWGPSDHCRVWIELR